MDDLAYFALITADILLDRGLTSTAKILFATITSLTKKCGYCYASNEYLGEIIKKDPRTVQRIIKKLNYKGDITVIIENGFDRIGGEGPIYNLGQQQNIKYKPKTFEDIIDGK
ncbi:MAG: helix-turn-helix domain-containing protein [Nanoarchaeota archaeon]